MRFLKFRRLQLDLTQRSVAKKARMFPQVLSNVERGRVVPSADELARLGKILDCPPDRLMVHVDATPLGDGAAARMRVRDEARDVVDA